MKQKIVLKGKSRDFVNEEFANKIGNILTPLALAVMKYNKEKPETMYPVMDSLLELGDRLNEFDLRDYEPTFMVNPKSIGSYRRLFDLDFTNDPLRSIDVINSAIEHFYLTRKKEKEFKKGLLVETNKAVKLQYIK